MKSSKPGRWWCVRATVDDPEILIAIEQFGGNDNPDRGDAYKGAAPMRSRSARATGIGMDVYKGLHDERTRDGKRRSPERLEVNGVTPPEASIDAEQFSEPERCATDLTSRNMLHASPACGASWECLNTAHSGRQAIAK